VVWQRISSTIVPLIDDAPLSQPDAALSNRGIGASRRADVSPRFHDGRESISKKHCNFNNLTFGFPAIDRAS